MNANATGEQIVVIVGAGLAGGNAAVTLREGARSRASLSAVRRCPKPIYGVRKTSMPGMSSPPTGMVITTLNCAPGPPCGR
jgi:hypothetical protein